MPKVSIITTFLNREEYLATAIASVLNQTFTDFELILWDDGSSDQSLVIASEFADRDERITLLSSAHIGRTPALIEASKLAVGEYLGVVDSDDLISLNCLEMAVAVLDQAPEIGLTYTNCLLINQLGQPMGARKQSLIPYSYDRFLIDFIPFHFRLYRSDLFKAVGGYNPCFIHAEDYDLTLRLAEQTQLFHIPEAIYYYRQHLDSIGANNRIEQIYWSKKAIEESLIRTKDKRQIKVFIPEAKFRLAPG